MLNNNDFNYILKRVLSFLIIALILFCFNSCKVKAYTISTFIQRPRQNNYMNFYEFNGLTKSIRLTDSSGNNASIFANEGEGTFIFSIDVANKNNPTSTILSIEAGTENASFSCDIGNNQTYNDNLKINLIITAKCNVNIDSSGIRYIIINRAYNDGTLIVALSDMGTFVSKDGNVSVNVNQQQVVNAIDSSNQAMISAIQAQQSQAHQDAQQAHQDAQQAHQDSQNINNSINDSTPVSNNEISGNATDWNNNNLQNGTITQLVTLPITLIQAYLNGINSSCSQFNLGSLFGTNLVLPCINISSYLGTALWSTIDILFSGFMILSISKKLIKIFNDFTNLNSNQAEELYGGGA